MTNFDEIEEYENLQGSLDEFTGIEDMIIGPKPDNINYFEDFDNTLSDIDFSEIRGDFKSSLRTANRKLGKSGSKTRRARKPLSKRFAVNKNTRVTGGAKKLSKVIVPNDRKVIVEGVSKFILSKDPQDDAIKNIGYYKGKRLNQLVLTFNNNSGVDFDFELFNPSMPLDYLYSTSLNLNDKVQVAGGEISYTDVLFNLLANPALIVNAKFVFSGPSVNQQISLPLIVKNKAITGVQKVSPLNLALKVDNMQVANDIVFFNVMESLNRPFIPDGMDVMQYKIYAGNTVTMAFFYKQISIKKVLLEEARESKILL
jgi:hypothetical protein